MSRFLVATMPIPGHVAPFSPVVRKLLGRGHEVLWYGSRFFKDSIEATGARFEPITNAVDFGDSQYNKYFPERARLEGLRQIVFDFTHLFVGSIPGMMQDLEAILKRYPADVILHDSAVGAAFLLGDMDKLPNCLLNISVAGFQSRDTAVFGLGLPYSTSPLALLRNRLSYSLVDNIIFREPNRVFRKMARAHDWPVFPFRPRTSKFLTLQPSTPEFEYPMSDLADTVHFIGPLLPDTPKNVSLPSWWSEVQEKRKPIILITQGTIATNANELIKPTLEALANEDVLVIATTGGKKTHELSFQIPANARVAPFIPFNLLMPHVDIYVTNGGYGGVTIALAHGVPVISGGMSEDKPEVSNRVSYAGVGINLKTARPTPEKVREAVREILQNSSYRERAKMIQRAFAQHDAPTEAAILLEKLCETRQPVSRGQVLSKHNQSEAPRVVSSP
jgi:MGT family glycosyltransferase